MRGTKEMWLATLGFAAAVAVFGTVLVAAVRTEVVPSSTSVGVVPAVRPEGEPQSAVPEIQAARPDADATRAPASDPVPRAVEALVAESVTPAFPRTELQRAVSQDPFQPERRAPARRYTLPGQRVVVTRPEREPVEPPEFRVVGSARMGTGGLALVQVDTDEPVRAVSVGETIDGYMLASVNETGATLVRNGQSFDLRVTEPERPQPRGNRGRGNGRGNQNDQAAQFQQLQEQLQQQLQQQLGRGGRGAVQGGLGALGLGGANIRIPFGQNGIAVPVPIQIPQGGRGGGGE